MSKPETQSMDIVLFNNLYRITHFVKSDTCKIELWIKYDSVFRTDGFKTIFNGFPEELKALINSVEALKKLSK